MYILCACAHIYVFVCAYACECKFSFLKLVSMLNISDTCRASPEGGRHLHVKSFNKATYCLDNNNENSFFKKNHLNSPSYHLSHQLYLFLAQYRYVPNNQKIM